MIDKLRLVCQAAADDRQRALVEVRVPGALGGVGLYSICVNFAKQAHVSVRGIATHDADIFRRLSMRQGALRGPNGLWRGHRVQLLAMWTAGFVASVCAQRLNRNAPEERRKN